MDFSGLLDSIVKSGNVLYTTFNTLCSMMFVPLNETYLAEISLVFPVFNDFLAFTLAEVLIGGGLFLFITYTLIKWVLDIVF